MPLNRWRRTVRLVTVLAVACLGLLVYASGHAGVANGVTPHDTSCPSETTSCTQVAFPCPGCTASAGPVTNLGLDQAVYVQVTGVPAGDELEIAYCSLAGGAQVVAQPQCASQSLPSGTAEPSQYQYGVVTANQTVVSIPSEYDPDIGGAQPITSETTDQFENGQTTSSFFCDNAANPCGVEVMLIPEQFVIGPGYPPSTGYSAVGNAVVFPLTFDTGGSGCGSAPIMQVDASYSVAQFIPAAGLGTCNGPSGVAAISTELPSVDDPGCVAGTGTHCPIYDLIDGTVPVSFTDDPENPATLAEEKQAGGKFAYIPIALSGTEIAFKGGAGVAVEGNTTVFPLDSYQLTPAMAAGIMTQQWTAAEAGLGAPNDDVCPQIPASTCSETTKIGSSGTILVESANGKTDNLDVSQATTITSKKESFPINIYDGNFAAGSGQTLGVAADYGGDTGYVLLNPWPFSFGGSTVNEFFLGSMWPSTGSGATFESTQWMCNAPNSTYSVNLPWGGQANVKDFLTGQQLLANAERDPVAAPKNKSGLAPGVVFDRVPAAADKCQALSTLPIDLASQSAIAQDLYLPSSQPVTAAHAMQSAAAKYGSNGGFAFSAMDASEADFFGLLPSSLENATGTFVAPSTSSLEAGVNDATANPDGTITPNWNDTGDSSAYPMPLVTYALVSTAPQPTATGATELKNLLTDLVTYSNQGGTSTSPLPPGYAPLPSSLYNAALADISNDILGPGGSTPGSGSSGGSGATPSTNSHPAGAGAGAGVGAGAAASGRTGSGSSAAGTSSSTAPAQSGSSGSSSPGAFVGHLITVTVGDNRFFVPVLFLLALLCLIAGPLLYLSPDLRRRAGSGGADDVSDAAVGGPGPPETG